MKRKRGDTMADKLEVKFWGVRGSHPTPGAVTVRYGGNTACVEIRAGDKTVILDAGTGIIPLGRELSCSAAASKSPLEVMLIFSHLHHDHTQGFPFFVPAYLPHACLHIYGPGISPETLESVLEDNQSPTTFPVGLREMAATKDIRSLHEKQVIVWDEAGVHIREADAGFGEDALVVRIHKSYAHPGGVYCYRVEWCGQSIVYATDTEGYVGTDRRLAQFALGADLLIHDAQYSEAHYAGQLAGFPATQGYGHSTVDMACELATSAEVGGLALFHHDPSNNDDTVDELQTAARERFTNTLAAHEGLEIELLTPRVGETPRSSLREQWRVKYAHNG